MYLKVGKTDRVLSWLIRVTLLRISFLNLTWSAIFSVSKKKKSHSFNSGDFQFLQVYKILKASQSFREAFYGCARMFKTSTCSKSVLCGMSFL